VRLKGDIALAALDFADMRPVHNASNVGERCADGAVATEREIKPTLTRPIQ